MRWTPSTSSAAPSPTRSSTVKLWERPTPYELQKQLEVVAEKLPDIYRSGTTLNIWLERETTQGQPPQQ